MEDTSVVRYWPVELMARRGFRRGPVLRTRIGRQRYAWLLSPEANELVFAHDNWFSVREAMQGLVPVDGETSVVVSDGADHARRRGLLRPALAPRNIEAYLPAMHLSAGEAVGDLPAGTPVDAYPVFRRAIRRSTLRALFGPAMAEEADALGELLQPMLDLVDGLPQAVGVHRRLRTRPWRRAAAARERLDAYIARRIDESERSPDGAHGILGLLVHGRDGDGSGLTRQEVRDQAVTLVAAGYETTSAAMGWTVHCLAHHPQWQERARAEAEALVADAGAPPRDGVLGAVVAEVLRLYPPATISARHAQRDFTVHGERVCRGDVVIFSPYATHRDPRVHDRPEEFDPARWLGGWRPDPGTYLPFGGGAHRCIGSHLALSELAVMTAHLVAAGPFAPAGRRPGAHGFAAMRPSRAFITRAGG